MLCNNACPRNPQWASDGLCDDGGPGHSYRDCDYGTDCADCGPRPAMMALVMTETNPSDVNGSRPHQPGADGGHNAAAGGDTNEYDDATDTGSGEYSLDSHASTGEWFVPVLIVSGLATSCAVVLACILARICMQRCGGRVSYRESSKRATSRRATSTASSGSTRSADLLEAQPDVEIPVFAAAPVA